MSANAGNGRSSSRPARGGAFSTTNRYGPFRPAGVRRRVLQLYEYRVRLGIADVIAAVLLRLKPVDLARRQLDVAVLVTVAGRLPQGATGEARAGPGEQLDVTDADAVTDPAGLTNDAPTASGHTCGTGGTLVTDSYSFTASSGTSLPSRRTLPETRVSCCLSDASSTSASGRSGTTSSRAAWTLITIA